MAATRSPTWTCCSRATTPSRTSTSPSSIDPKIIIHSDPEEPASEVSCSELDTCDPDWVEIVLDGVLRDAAANLLDIKTRKITKRALHIIKLRGERAGRILTGFSAVRTHAMKTRAR